MNKHKLQDLSLDEINIETLGHEIPLTIEQLERILFAVSHITMLQPMEEETRSVFLKIYEYLLKQLEIAREWEKERNTKAGIIKEKLLINKRKDFVSFVLITESDNWIVLRGTREKAYLIKEALENIHTIIIKDGNETEVDKTGEMIEKELCK